MAAIQYITDLWPLSLDTSVAARLYVKVHKFNGTLYEDKTFTPAEAEEANERLANDGQPYEWAPFADEPEIECFQCQSFPCVCGEGEEVLEEPEEQ